MQGGSDNRVNRAEGFVHQQHRGVGGERPGHADPLLLPAGQLVGVTAGQVVVQADQAHELPGPVPGPGLLPAEQQRDGADVVLDGLVREQARLLDDVADAAPQRGRVRLLDVLAVQQDPAAGGVDQAVDHAQVVVFPQPLGPTRTMVWPPGTSRSRLSTATVPPGYRFVTLSKVIKTWPSGVPRRTTGDFVGWSVPATSLVSTRDAGAQCRPRRKIRVSARVTTCRERLLIPPTRAELPTKGNQTVTSRITRPQAGSTGPATSGNRQRQRMAVIADWNNDRGQVG